MNEVYLNWFKCQLQSWGEMREQATAWSYDMIVADIVYLKARKFYMEELIPTREELASFYRVSERQVRKAIIEAKDFEKRMQKTKRDPVPDSQTPTMKRKRSMKPDMAIRKRSSTGQPNANNETKTIRKRSSTDKKRSGDQQPNANNETKTIHDDPSNDSKNYIPRYIKRVREEVREKEINKEKDFEDDLDRELKEIKSKLESQ